MKTITLDDATFDALFKAMSTPSGSSSTPPVPTPPVIISQVPPYVLPTAAAGLTPLLVPMPWKNGTRLQSDIPGGCVLAMPFTTGADGWATGSFRASEYRDQQNARYAAIVRNRDAVVVANLPVATNSPSFNFLTAVPPPRSGKFQLEPGVLYTLAIWNAVPPQDKGHMAVDLYFQQ